MWVDGKRRLVGGQSGRLFPRQIRSTTISFTVCPEIVPSIGNSFINTMKNINHTIIFFIINIRPLLSTLFPYTTLFRSQVTCNEELECGAAGEPLNRGFRCASSGHRSEEHTSELQSRQYLVCRLLLVKKNFINTMKNINHTRSSISDDIRNILCSSANMR